MNHKNILFKNFKLNKKTSNTKKILTNLLKEDNKILQSLSKNYSDSYTKKSLSKYKNLKNIRIIGMGGSSLGTRAIYSFLKHKIKKNLIFFDNLQPNRIKDNKKHLNLIVSKSGNTLETIVNTNIYINKFDKNIFITENKKNYLHILANKLKSEVVHHNNYIGGRYSVLSEVGMLPADLMGLKPDHFRQFNQLIKNKKFLNNVIQNVTATVGFLKNKKLNSVILNYDEKAKNLFNWYQQLIAESLGKKGKGLLPVISNLPKDNHSVMQLYLDGFKNNFFTFFYTHEKKSFKIKNSKILSSQNYLKNRNLSEVIYAQKKATENVFRKKNIPFRSFEIKNRDERALGELFCFFILETILIGKSLNLNPYDQPAVELIKLETKKILT
ncbi:glucose-6-phosphate isomerase [Pelagibacterales bacterium SAG-MED22]|nr:glucose-6-phosphate isomerase [Pelagibacterales bacterium SAG-MED22]